MDEQSREYFLGIARVRFSALQFRHEFSAGHRELSAPLVKKLAAVFRLEGCLRNDEENFITALTTREDLNHALGSPAALLPLTYHSREPPNLPIHTVYCLNGLHRIAAAREHLATDGTDPWWVVRLYTTDLPSSFIQSIVEEYQNQQPFTDGEIWWKIMHYESHGNVRAEQKWKARLTQTKQRELERLYKKLDLLAAFRNLHRFRGLWPPIKLGTLHRLLCMKCDEEMINYLRHIRDIWQQILGNLPTELVDNATVTAIQSQSPGMSDTSLFEVTSAIRERRAFADVATIQERDRLVQNVTSITCLIPSITTFFNNLKYFEPCCIALRGLIKVGPKDTIRRSFFDMWRSNNAPVVQVRENYFQTTGCQDLTMNRLYSYWQLWLFAIRNFPELTNFSPLQDTKGVKKAANDYSQPRCRQSSRSLVTNSGIWYRFARLAIKLGFSTPEIIKLCAQKPSEQLAIQVLANERASTISSVDLGRGVAYFLAQASGYQEQSFEVPATTIADEPVLRRSGFPTAFSHKRDAKKLYLPIISTYPEHVISSLFVKYDTIKYFLGLNWYAGISGSSSGSSLFTTPLTQPYESPPVTTPSTRPHDSDHFTTPSTRPHDSAPFTTLPTQPYDPAASMSDDSYNTARDMDTLHSLEFEDFQSDSYTSIREDMTGACSLISSYRSEDEDQPPIGASDNIAPSFTSQEYYPRMQPLLFEHNQGYRASIITQQSEDTNQTPISLHQYPRFTVQYPSLPTPEVRCQPEAIQSQPQIEYRQYSLPKDSSGLPRRGPEDSLPQLGTEDGLPQREIPLTTLRQPFVEGPRLSETVILQPLTEVVQPHSTFEHRLENTSVQQPEAAPSQSNPPVFLAAPSQQPLSETLLSTPWTEDLPSPPSIMNRLRPYNLPQNLSSPSPRNTPRLWLQRPPSSIYSDDNTRRSFEHIDSEASIFGSSSEDETQPQAPSQRRADVMKNNQKDDTNNTLPRPFSQENIETSAANTTRHPSSQRRFDIIEEIPPDLPRENLKSDINNTLPRPSSQDNTEIPTANTTPQPSSQRRLDIVEEIPPDLPRVNQESDINNTLPRPFSQDNREIPTANTTPYPSSQRCLDIIEEILPNLPGENLESDINNTLPRPSSQDNTEIPTANTTPQPSSQRRLDIIEEIPPNSPRINQESDINNTLPRPFPQENADIHMSDVLEETPSNSPSCIRDNQGYTDIRMANTSSRPSSQQRADIIQETLPNSQTTNHENTPMQRGRKRSKRTSPSGDLHFRKRKKTPSRLIADLFNLPELSDCVWEETSEKIDDYLMQLQQFDRVTSPSLVVVAPSDNQLGFQIAHQTMRNRYEAVNNLNEYLLELRRENLDFNLIPFIEISGHLKRYHFDRKTPFSTVQTRGGGALEHIGGYWICNEAMHRLITEKLYRILQRRPRY